MKNIAIIPARGGSKRLKSKNILPFDGKPMIEYSVEAALKSGLFDRVVVSTEDKKIIHTVSGLGCDVDERNPLLATDTASVVDVLRDLVTRLEAGKDKFDYLCCLYATSPLRTWKDVKLSFDLMIEKKADYCLSVTEFETSPFFAFNIDEASFIQRRWPDKASLPPRKKPPVVVDNGSIYWAKVEKFLETGVLTGENCTGYRMPRWKSVDIDTLTDLKLAEFYLREMNND